MKVLLIDDHPLILTALQRRDPGHSAATSRWSASRSARGAREALAAEPNFDLVLLDLRLGDADGFELLVELRNAWPAVPVVVVSASDRSADVIRAIDLGAMGFVPKRASNETLTEALHVVMSGGIYVPPMTTMARHRRRRRRRRRRRCVAARRRHARKPQALAAFKLTPRQTDVLGLLLRGQSNKLIARELNLSVETVKDHVAAVLRALGVNSRTQAVLAVSQMSSQGRSRHGSRAGCIERGRRRCRRERPPRGAAAPRAETPLDSFLLLRDHVRSTFAFNRTTLAGHAIGAIIVEIVFGGVAPRPLRIVWGVAVRARLAGARSGSPCASPATSRRPIDGLLARLRTWQAGVLASGVLWGAAAWLFSAYGSGSQQLALMLVVYTFCVACVPILAPQFRLFLLFVPARLRAGDRPRRARRRRPSAGSSPLVMSVAMAMTILLGRNYRESFDNVVGLKLRTEALAVQLGAEKAVADAARHEAEVANRAKTQFFTAASHDLRQPLHAMGLFAEALRAAHPRARGGAARQQHQRIGRRARGPVLGAARHHPDRQRRRRGQPRALRARRDLPQGCACTSSRRRSRRGWRCASAAASTSRSPIRCWSSGSCATWSRTRSATPATARCWSAAGGAASACCCRSGTPARASARASGRASSRSSTRCRARRRCAVEQKKGLGLGLAIVKRLAELMDAPLTLRSETGRGSVFTLELPVGTAPRAARRDAARQGADRHHARRPADRRRRGRAGGARGPRGAAHAAGAPRSSPSRASPRPRPGPSAADPARAPALIIADYRLEQRRDRRRRDRRCCASASAPRVPAIVVTGSSMTGHDKEALEHDFHLLIKPVLPNKLRAMIAFKLGRR